MQVLAVAIIVVIVLALIFFTSDHEKIFATFNQTFAWTTQPAPLQPDTAEPIKLYLTNNTNNST